MDKKEYLNEEKYQQTNKKVKTAGMVMIIIGAIMFLGLLASIIMQSGTLGKDNASLIGLLGIIGVIGLPVLGIGLFLRFILANQREITAYHLQQQMPVAQEGLEKVAPTVGKVAKEVAKGIKEGLNEADKK